MPKQANPIDSQVGNRLRLRRMIMGLSQEKLGERVGLTFQQIQKYEKGLNRIGAGRLFELAHVLGVSVNYFYEGVPEHASPDGESEEGNAVPIMEFLATS